MSLNTDLVQLDFAPIASQEAVIHSGNARFTVLTDRLIRLEYGCFEDRPSQPFWYRQQPVPEFSVVQRDDGLDIETAYLRLEYRAQDGVGFTPETLSIRLK